MVSKCLNVKKKGFAPTERCWSFLMHLCYQCFAPLEQKDDGVIIIHRINIPAESDSLVAKRLSGLFPLQRSGTLVE